MCRPRLWSGVVLDDLAEEYDRRQDDAWRELLGPIPDDLLIEVVEESWDRAARRPIVMTYYKGGYPQGGCEQV